MTLRLVSTAMIATALVCQGQTSTVLYVPPTNSTRDNYTGAVGNSFKVGASNVVVSHLGYYSLNTNTGLAISHNVGLFTGGAGQNPPVYGLVVVPAGMAAYWMSNYYWMPLNPPLLLASNTIYTLVGLATSGDGDAWHDLYTASWNPAITGSATVSGGDGIYGPGNSTWPPASTGNNGLNNTYGAPNMANIPIGPAYVGVQQTNLAISAGATLTVLGFATGQTPISYQWYLETTNKPLAGQTNATLSIPNVGTGNSDTYFLIATNSLGGEQSSNVVVTVSAIPVSITQQPSNTTVFGNYPATFSVTAIGTPPIYYQWSRNGTAVAGATNSSYTVTPVNTNNGDVYSCLVSNYISLTPKTQVSSNAVLTVTYNLAYPQVFLHGYSTALGFNSYSGQVGGQFTTGNQPPLVTHLGYYAWPANSTTNGTNVTCVLTNSAHYVGLYTGSGSALLGSVQIPQGTNPVVNGYMWQPLNPPLVLATNTQYLLDAQTLSGDDPWGDVYSLPDLSSYFAASCDAIYGGTAWGGTPSINGKYSGDMYSAPNMAILAQAAPEAWALPETGITTNAGFTETLTAIVAGQAPISIQWYEEPGQLLTNQTNLTLTLSNLNTGQSGSYYVLASNYVTHSTGQSEDLVVTVIPDTPPQVSQDIAPVSPVLVLGSSISFSASFLGSPSFTYGWQFNGTAVTNSARISGANGNVLTINGVQASDAGTYQLLVTNSVGNGASSQTTLTVVPLLPFNNGLGFSSQGNTVSWPSSNILELTQGFGSESNSAFSSGPLYVGAFQASFTYQVISPFGSVADGVAFCLQNDPRGATALGEDGGDLGYGPTGSPGITNSVAFEMDLFANGGSGVVGFGTNGSIGPYGTTTNGTPSLVLTNGDVISNFVTYNGTTLAVTMTDVSVGSTNFGATFSTNANINMPSVLGTNVAFVGFTGGDGGTRSIQQIGNFTFVSMPQLSAKTAGTNLLLSWNPAIGSFMLKQNTNLASTNWTPVAAAPTLVNGQDQVTIPISGKSTFYELVVTNVPNL